MVTIKIQDNSLDQPNKMCRIPKHTSMTELSQRSEAGGVAQWLRLPTALANDPTLNTSISLGCSQTPQTPPLGRSDTYGLLGPSIHRYI